MILLTTFISFFFNNIVVCKYTKKNSEATFTYFLLLFSVFFNKYGIFKHKVVRQNFKGIQT